MLAVVAAALALATPALAHQPRRHTGETALHFQHRRLQHAETTIRWIKSHRYLLGHLGLQPGIIDVYVVGHCLLLSFGFYFDFERLVKCGFGVVVKQIGEVSAKTVYGIVNAFGVECAVNLKLLHAPSLDWLAGTSLMSGSS